MAKGAILVYPTIIGFIVALGIFYLMMAKMPDTGFYIGEIQMATLKTMQEAEKDLLYVDNAADIAGQQAIYELADKGGFKDNSDCGEYGYQLWNNNDRECFPDYKNNFTSLFNDKLNIFLSKFNLIDNYNFLINQNDKLQILGLAISDLTLDIRVVLDKIKAIVEYIIPKDAEEIVKKIKEVYGNKILREIEGKDPKPEESLIIAIIAQESQGKPDAISSTGCAGLMQFCYGTATDFKDVFVKLTPCDCTGDICKTAPKCNINNDDRLDPDKSIESGVKYISQLLKKFEKDDYKEEFAVASYNGGIGVIENAIKKTNKNNPSWPEVAQQITPDLITYFKNISERKGKVQQIIQYVNLVMGYKKKYEELSQNQITGAVIKTASGKSLGKYSIKPSFKVDLDYNIDEYQKVIDNAKILIKNCENKDKTEECIKNEINKFEKKERYTLEGYETEEEKIVNEFIGLYEECYNSIGNCYCNITFDKESTLEYDKDYALFKINNYEKEYTLNLIPFLKKLEIKKNEIKAELLNPEKDIEKKYTLEGNLVFYKQEIEDPMGKGKINSMQIVKKKSNKIELYDGRKVENVNECQIKPQRKFKFIYNTSKSVLTEEGMKEPIIKFALMFPDITPPEALNVNALNYPNDKYKIILTWNKAEEDTVMYKIYYSNNDFKKKKNNELKADLELNLDAEEIEDIDLNKCEFKPEGEPCKFDKYNKKLDINKLYYLKKENEYVYVLNLEGNYNFLVTAVDDSDNEIKDIQDKNYKTIKSENKLQFNEVGDLKVKQEGGNVKLTWKKPDKYKDGSDFKEEELKGYKVRLVESTGPNSQIIPQDDYIKITEHTFININIGDYYYSVFAVNNDGVEGEYASYP